MGYTTEFTGRIKIEPPLNKDEIKYLKKFNETRRMKRQKGPYYVDNAGFAGQDKENDILDYNSPPDGQPGLWCQWTPTSDGQYIEWDGGEKFYDSEEWMAYIIDHFLKPNAVASKVEDNQFKNFTFNHVCNGQIACQGEERSDNWQINVENNVVNSNDLSHLYQELDNILFGRS